jgi:proteic killer suppression protein
MIVKIRHRGLRRFHEDNDASGLNAQHVEKIRLVLTVLEDIRRPEEAQIHGFRLHSLKDDMAGYWSITVRANWRIIFRVENENVADVDLVDYH